MKLRGISLRTGVRVGVGIVVLGIAAASVVAIGAGAVPSFGGQPPKTVVDTAQKTLRTVVCGGGYVAVQEDVAAGAGAAVVGKSSMAVAGEAKKSSDLSFAGVQADAKDNGSAKGAAWGKMLQVPFGSAFGAAEVQSVATDDLKGLVGASCSGVSNEHWFVGGGTDTGTSSTLELSNPGTVPATVQVRVYDENGALQAVNGAGVIVPAGAQKVVLLSGYAPASNRLAVHVVSVGAAVAARIGVGQVSGLDPVATSWVQEQPGAAKSLVIPAVTNISEIERGPGDAGEGDDFPVRVRVFAPDKAASGEAAVYALKPSGERVALGTVKFEKSQVAELTVPVWPKGAQAVLVESPEPVFAAVLGNLSKPDGRDNEWFVPVSPLAAGSQVAVPGVDKGTLVLANPGSEPAKVQLAAGSASAKEKTVNVPAGAAVSVGLAGNTWVSSSAPVAAAVRVVDGTGLAGFAVQPVDPAEGKLVVFTR